MARTVAVIAGSEVRMAEWWRTPSSTRSTSGASPTRTATASVTSRDPLPAPLRARARRRRHLADAVLPLPGRRPRLRRVGLRRRRSALRHARRLRRARRRRARARPARDRRPRPEPHVERAPVVPERARRPEHPDRDALLLPARPRRRPAEQLDVRLRRPGLDARRAERRVVPAPLRARAARPRLAQRAGSARLRGHPPLLARPRRRRLPHRRRAGALQGPDAARDGRAEPRACSPTGTPGSTSRRCTPSTAAGGSSPTSTPGDRIFVGEIVLAEPGDVAQYVRPDELQLAFNFSLLCAEWDAERCARRSTRR